MKHNILIIVILSTLLLGGCRKWMDINHNPNDATKDNVSPELLLTSCQYDLSDILINSSNSQILAHHFTKSGEYSGTYVFLTGLLTPQNIDGWWETYYTLNANLKSIYEKSKENKNQALEGISELLSVFNYQRLVDIFGNIPYSQACQPNEYPTPAYDKDSDVYASLLSRIDMSIAALQGAIASKQDMAVIKKADIICKGDLNLWLYFAYSQKLRLLMRVSGVQDVSAALTQIVDKCLPISSNIEMNPGYYVESGKMNIFYQNYGYNNLGGEVGTHREYMPTSTLIDMLRDNNDPRLRVYADPRPTLGSPSDGLADYEKFGLSKEYYVGIPYGQMQPPRMSYTCKIGLGLLARGSNKNVGAVKSTTIIGGAEVGFFLAEAALKGLIPGGDAKAKEYYEAAVTSAMLRHEDAMKDTGYPSKNVRPAITTSANEAAKTFLAQNNDFVNWSMMKTQERKLEAIHSQKWISMVGYNPLECWFEHRRVDLPHLSSSHSGQENKNICKLPYPQTERNLNGDNVKAQGDVDIYESLVFWDKANPIVPRTEPYL